MVANGLKKVRQPTALSTGGEQYIEGQLGLKWEDLQWGSGRLYVRRQVQTMRGEVSIFQEPKTRARYRTIQLGEGTLQVFRLHHEHQQLQKAFAGQRWQENDLIFPSSIGTPKDPDNLRLDFYRMLDRSGVPKVRFHDCGTPLPHSCLIMAFR
jgi:integrase